MLKRYLENPVLDMETGVWSGKEVWLDDSQEMRFDRAAQQGLKNAAGTATTTAAGYGNAAGGIAGQLTPTLEQQATNPTGFSPTDVNNQIVAGAQAAGGTTGAGGLASPATAMAARTHNVGALSGVLDQASRQRGQQLSSNALNVQNKNAMVKQSQQQAALGGLEKMYGTDVGAQLGSQGQVANDWNGEVKAGQSGWLQNTLGVIGTLTGAAKNAAGAYSDYENA